MADCTSEILRDILDGEADAARELFDCPDFRGTLKNDWLSGRIGIQWMFWHWSVRRSRTRRYRYMEARINQRSRLSFKKEVEEGKIANLEKKLVYIARLIEIAKLTLCMDQLVNLEVAMEKLQEESAQLLESIREKEASIEKLCSDLKDI